MKPMPLLIAVGVLAILGGLVYYTEENPPSSGDDKTPIVDVEEDSIQKVIVTRPDKDPIVLERGEDDKWNFGAPLTAPADQFSINSMVSSLASMNSDRVVEENVINWAPYGLTGQGTAQVEAVVEEGEDAKTYRVIFGSDTPTGSGVYARLEGDTRLFTVYSYVKTTFEKEVFDLRDKKLLQVDEDKISRIVLNAAAGSIEFGKTGDDTWQILRPQPLRADNFTVGDLVRSVRNAEMMSVLEEGEESSETYDFSKPAAAVEIVDEAGTHTLTIAKDSDDNYYAKSSDLEGGVYEVSSTMAGGLDKKLEDFRNKKLFDFGFQEIAKLELRDGDTRVVAEKKEDKWRLTSADERELDSGKVQTAIDWLRGLTAKSFTSDDKADLDKYGLSSPAIEAKVATTEGSGEEVMISSPEEDLVYAARAGQPSTYEVEKSAVEAIQQSIKDLLEQEEAEGEEDPPNEP